MQPHSDQPGSHQSPLTEAELENLKQGLVEHLKQTRCIRSSAVEAAFRTVPRHLFLPQVSPTLVYQDQVVPTKVLAGVCVSSSSQPAIMAIMLEQLDLRPGMRVLEIGAGTGYNAALLAQIVGENGSVVTMDIDEDLVEGAREHLKAAGYGRVQVVLGDGALGHPEGAPYDRIILTVGSDDILPAWWDQLAPTGVLLLPLTLRDSQLSIAFRRHPAYLESISINPCGFMMLRGPFAQQGSEIKLGPIPYLTLRLGEPRPVDAEAIYQQLSSPGRDLPSGVHLTTMELLFGLRGWLSLHEPAICGLRSYDQAATQELVPGLFRIAGPSMASSTLGLLEDQDLALLVRPPSQADTTTSIEVFELFVRSYRPDAALAQRLIARLREWDAVRRNGGDGALPRTERSRIRVYRQASDYASEADRSSQPDAEAEEDYTITRPWSYLLIQRVRSRESPSEA